MSIIRPVTTPVPAATPTAASVGNNRASPSPISPCRRARGDTPSAGRELRGRGEDDAGVGGGVMSGGSSWSRLLPRCSTPLPRSVIRRGRAPDASPRVARSVPARATTVTPLSPSPPTSTIAWCKSSAGSSHRTAAEPMRPTMCRPGASVTMPPASGPAAHVAVQWRGARFEVSVITSLSAVNRRVRKRRRRNSLFLTIS